MVKPQALRLRHHARMISRRIVLLSGAAALALPARSAPDKPLVEVWKDPSCGCCVDWVRHLEANGFAVRLHDTGNTAMRARLGIAPAYGSCHTARVGGYAIEGHVPAREMHRLLKERPAALGLAVEALLERDGAKAKSVITGDRVIDTMEMEIEETCINLLALQQPMARDLRMLTSALKIANDLERVGDHAVNIAQSAERLAQARPITPEPEIVEMARLARDMLSDALEAFIRGDARYLADSLRQRGWTSPRWRKRRWQ